AEAIAATKAGGLLQFGNVVGDVMEKFGLFTSTIKANVVKVMLPHIQRLNESLAKLIKEGKIDEWARSASDTIVKAFGGIAKIFDDIAGSVEKLKKALNALKTTAKAVGTAMKWYALIITGKAPKVIAEEILKGITGGPTTGPTFKGKVPPRPAAAAPAKPNIWGSPDFDWSKPASDLPVIKGPTFEPKIKKSPAVGWDVGIASMNADLAGLGGTMQQTFDLSAVTGLLQSMRIARSQLHTAEWIGQMGAGGRNPALRTEIER
ncbi:unnamed protein product, partial [marine sediment metagenome]